MSWDEWCDENCYSWSMSMVSSSVVVVVAGDFVGVTVGLVSSVVDGCASVCWRMVRTCSAVWGSLSSSRSD